MNRTLTVVVLAALVAFGGLFFYRDHEFRKVHGTVTEVNLVTWEQEVANTKDTRPVLIYFYRESERTPANEAQNKEVRDFAWNTAGKVKVVSVNVSHVENLPIAFAHGAFRQPGFAFVYGEEAVAGPSGVLVTADDLQRLLEAVQSHKAQGK
jgi:hypothetical protein